MKFQFFFDHGLRFSYKHFIHSVLGRIFNYYISFFLFGSFVLVNSTQAVASENRINEWSLRQRSQTLYSIGAYISQGDLSDELIKEGNRLTGHGLFLEGSPFRAPVNFRLDLASMNRTTGNSNLGLQAQYRELRTSILGFYEASPVFSIFVGMGGGVILPEIDLRVTQRHQKVEGQTRYGLGTLIGLRMQSSYGWSVDLFSDAVYSSLFPNGYMNSFSGALVYTF